jgi:outer membrane protein OmpA-like peptidoglycan-associated protein
MAEKRRTSLKATIGGTCFLTLFIAPVAITSIATKSHNAQAQQTDGVSVNLDVLDDLNPISKTPRLLMPRMTPRNGRVALTPPPGLGRISQQPSRVVLRPPPGAPQRLTTAVKIAVPRRAPAAVTPPVSVTTAPSAPEMVSDAVPPQSPTPIIELKDSEQTAQAQDSITEEQTSALPAPSLNDEPISITFGVDETDLPSSADSTLVPLAERMQSNQNVRVQLLAYASKANGSVSSVRRKSLSRALSVRKFLMDRGIQSTRIEVRALGDKNEGGAPDRIDAIFQQR